MVEWWTVCRLAHYQTNPNAGLELTLFILGSATSVMLGSEFSSRLSNLDLLEFFDRSN